MYSSSSHTCGVSLLDLIRSHTSIKFKKHTKTEYCGACPFCQTGTDRFIIFTDSNRFWCRQCEKKGDAIQFLRDYCNLSYPDACKALSITPKDSKEYRNREPEKPEPEIDGFKFLKQHLEYANYGKHLSFSDFIKHSQKVGCKLSDNQRTNAINLFLNDIWTHGTFDDEYRFFSSDKTKRLINKNVFSHSEILTQLFGNEPIPAFISVNPFTGLMDAESGSYGVEQTVKRFTYCLLEFDDKPESFWTDSEREQYEKSGRDKNFIPKMPLQWQLAILGSSDLPIFSITFTGSVSLHALCHAGCKNLEQWNEMIKSDTFKVFTSLGFDRATKSASQLTRLPGGTNEKTGNKAMLIYLNNQCERLSL